MNVVTLNKSNFRDPVATLRVIADQIENGDYGDVNCIGVVLLGDSMEVFGAGQDCEVERVAILLHSGFQWLSKRLGDGEF